MHVGFTPKHSTILSQHQSSITTLLALLLSRARLPHLSYTRKLPRLVVCSAAARINLNHSQNTTAVLLHISDLIFGFPGWSPMHELLLFGQVPRSRHDEMLKVLAGVAAMQPQRVIERHVVYRPNRDPQAPGRTGQVGGSQAVATDKRSTQAQAVKDLYFTKLVQDLTEDDFEKEGKALAPGGTWAMQFYDVPDAAKRPVIYRTANTTPILQGDAHNYMKDFQYNYVGEHILEGHRYVHKNVVILLHRLLTYHELPPSQSPVATLPSYESLKPVDPSGAYIMQTSVRLVDNAGPDNLGRGQEELVKFQGTMKGIVELQVVDRLALDTRVKYNAAQAA
ncbi:hypothetical protein EJ05DRAFT_498982 [Pseudovirgaria hyperparasitica]|uniref:Mediator of RNA polymerase II transcription subunit 18 n=1 Tax=Pseudovirgaria hyperparasitica TaxID=470096 RepID=A0A6A6WF92_9PEZI|nr:uncharacterized protein EJ05DRAFT_498982 [Pseudovirgaria hyperparasitica]KAF2759781.1 hypothetical protein EJ05DRAFT_498982 [Pseudovirgaria hyperparasitica]